MQHDLGSRDVTRDIRQWIQDLAGTGPDYSTIPIQGSGTFAIEAVLTTFIRDGGKILVWTNGVYGEIAARIPQRHRLRHIVLGRLITEPIALQDVGAMLQEDPAITPAYFVHCETTSGILNPLPELTAIARNRGIAIIVDSMCALLQAVALLVERPSPL